MSSRLAGDQPTEEVALSPAERYRSAQERQRRAQSAFGEFEQLTEFQLDPFQVEACEALESGAGVLVAAPTGAGKTIVGEFAVFLALKRGCKAFYTTPIKALSNQKYAELAARYGAERVGLLTGDTSVNPEAQIVVMTTEVLRNMLYADSASLKDLGYVVMDEVHYLADRFRGAVWEEVIIHLPLRVQLVSLSATVSNAEEFGAWLDTVRGQTTVVVSEHRPVPLWQHVMVGKDLVDLFAGDEAAPSSARQVRGESRRKEGRDQVPAVNKELIQLSRNESRQRMRGRPPRNGRGRAERYQRRGGRSVSRDIPTSTEQGLVPRRVSRAQVIESLAQADLLPVITFIFSRAGCDAAVQQCVDAGLVLTNPEERRDIERRVESLREELPGEDLDVLGFWSWREGLLRGIAAHHAGMLPTFKEAVEELFADGLIKAVFATETLALGVNMPARSVILEKLEKFNGESHVNISAGEYTQLTGRAGRRGIDIEGHAVVLWQPDIDPAAVAGLAYRRTYPLNSSFRPTYNMSMNLIAQFGRSRARKILESSFAQFQADRSVVGLARQVRSREEAMAGYEEAMTCHLGDFAEYAALRRQLSDLESAASKQAGRNRREAINESLAALRVGDVIDVPAKPSYHGVVVVADPQARDPRPTLLTENRELHRLGRQEIQVPVEPLQRLRVPKSFSPRQPAGRRELAAQLRAAVRQAGGGAARSDHDRGANRRLGVPRDSGVEQEIAALRRRLRAHPCHGCNEREVHARWSERWGRLNRETESLKRQIQNRTGTIAKTFDRVCDLLAARNFIEKGENGELHPTADGQRLRRIYGEKDLLIALVLREGAFDDLNPEELAAFASALVYQAKREERGIRPVLPTQALEAAAQTLVRQWSVLEDDEEQARLPLTAEPDFGMVKPVYAWARGQRLEKVLQGTDFAAGDFVRWAKQVIDLLDQLAQAAGADPAESDLPDQQSLRKRCRAAIDLIRRGVVAYSAV
ncbi:DEAD/DEAH box helicase [Acaricomes phytoseiuli]|uniref:DEAD/DEAH box helicase n=1 Tax=Acaricomes phytoseiuli TaxID=291968 RepID=UPI002221E051|nr:DEAD/DEAH box helicase [Acaricomes phytoseiuli]MCW1248770.1 DEAD/DEAH box helicase [Acaricomes phytoseiuli]